MTYIHMRLKRNFGPPAEGFFPSFLFLKSNKAIGSVQVRDFGYFAVAPELLEVVALALLGDEDMDQGRAIVEDNPSGGFVAIIVIRLNATIFK